MIHYKLKKKDYVVPDIDVTEVKVSLLDATAGAPDEEAEGDWDTAKSAKLDFSSFDDDSFEDETETWGYTGWDY